MIQKQIKDANSSKSCIQFEKKIKKQTISLKNQYIQSLKKNNNNLLLLKKQPLNMFLHNFFLVMKNKKSKQIGSVQPVKVPLTPVYMSTQNNGLKSISIESTVLFFFLLQHYGQNLYNQEKKLSNLSINFYHAFCKKKLTVLNNYILTSQNILDRPYIQKNSKKKVNWFSNKEKNNYTKFLENENLYFLSCLTKNNNSILFFNKNIPTKYFFNYRNYFENIASSFYKTRTDFNFIKINGLFKSAQFIVDEIIYFLEKRIPYNKIKGRLKKELLNQRFGSHRTVKGIRIKYSGRLGGRTNKAERKKIDSWSFGQTSLHILSSKIDFAAGHAETKFGIAGIKVWLASDSPPYSL